MYMTMFLNHFRAVQNWAEKHALRTSLDMASFQLEIHARNRYYTLYPQFRERVDNRLANSTRLTPHTTGFLGWLPYQPIQWPLSTEKLLFKAHASEHGLPTPKWWKLPNMPDQDYVLKTSRGSWGREVFGPFKCEGQTPPTENIPDAQREFFAEQFIQGTNLKIWIWGRTVFHAHAHPYAFVVGDGESTVDELIEVLAQSQYPQSPRPLDEARGLATCLQYQGLTRSSIPEKDQSVWLEMRYGRDYRSASTTESADNCLSRLSSKILQQANAAAEILERALKAQLNAPVLYSLDGVVDAKEDIWWLEVNSNPSLPPTGYRHIFETLFSIPAIEQKISGLTAH